MKASKLYIARVKGKCLSNRIKQLKEGHESMWNKPEAEFKAWIERLAKQENEAMNRWLEGRKGLKQW
jgi:hypothetical protein